MTGHRFGFDDLVWNGLVDETVELLRAVGRRGGTISYSELARELRRRGQPEIDAHYGPMPYLLEAASQRVRELDRGAPLVSALVYRQDTNSPGGGFFKLAEREGYVVGDRDLFWAQHVAEVHEWARGR